MKTIVLTALIAAFGLSAAPSFAAVSSAPAFTHGALATDMVEKRRKPRVKGGSGCDDAGDAAEHPACR
ncbi:MAG: hypothetical protein HZT43_15285 [Exiguobacterium profundum]|nr:MAG: hypothetical protein HZT43_15285 [Exiguobacterium profundum]